MSTLRALRLRLSALLSRRRFEDELDEELRFHLEMETEQNLARGMSPEEARAAAKRAFGGMSLAKEDVRAVSGLARLDALGLDLRQALRSLAAGRSVALLVVLMLALGIGANTAVFSLLYGVLLRPLPYRDAGRLVLVDQRGSGGVSAGLSEAEVEELRRRSRTLEGVVEYHQMSFILLGGGAPERVRTGVVSPEFFETFGVEPEAGRLFEDGDLDGAPEPVLVLTHDYWRRAFGADPAVVGELLQMNDRAHRVVGVLPELPDFPDENDVYMPVTACPFRMDARFRRTRTSRMMSAVARVPPGLELEDAVSEIASISSAFADEHPEAYPESEALRLDVTAVTELLTASARPTLVLLLATSGFVLLIVCASVANINLARLTKREREMAMRAAMGASRLRLSRQLVVESLLVSSAGGILGLALAGATFGLLAPLARGLSPREATIALDPQVLGFTGLLAVVTAMAFGLAPALTFREGLRARLPSGLGVEPTRRIGKALVVAQLAISLALVSGAGLMLGSLHRLSSVDAGFEPDRVVTLLVDLNWSRYGSPDAIRAFHRSLLDTVSDVPSISHAAIGRTFPLDATADRWIARLSVPGHEGSQPPPRVDVHAVSPGFFRTMGIRLTRGRDFRPSDDESAPPVAIVNASAASALWHGESPIGRSIRGENGKPHEIVGVAGDVRQYGLHSEAVPSVYVPMAQFPFRAANLVVRTSSSPDAVVPDIVAAAQAIDPAQAIARVNTLERIVQESMATPARTTVLLALFAGLALLVAGLGLGGSLALAVRRRRREIGVRLALGASPCRLSFEVLAEGLRLAAAGVVLGVALALVLSRWLSDLLFEIEPHDPATLAIVCALLLVVAAGASFVPARLATRVDPLDVLRTE